MRNKLPYILLAVLFVGYLLMEFLMPVPQDWSQSYASNSDAALGSQLLYEALPDLFPSGEIEDVRKSPKHQLKEFEKASSNYIILENILEMDPYEAQALLTYARRGNSVFIAANNFMGSLSDSLGIRSKQDWAGNNLHYKQADSTALTSIGENAYAPAGGFSLLQGVDYFILPGVDPWDEVLGYDDDGDPVFARFEVGEGQILVHSVPLMFTNYNMVHPENQAYIAQCLSLLPDQKVYWDEYFKPQNVRNRSPLKYVLETPALRWAWLVLIGLVLVFMIFESKRRQRIIPSEPPLENTTLEFTRTVASLYQAHGDHLDIAKKKIKFLRDYLRQRWLIDTGQDHSEFRELLHHKSGVEKGAIDDLFDQVKTIESSESITEKTLVDFNGHLEAFYALSNRYGK